MKNCCKVIIYVLIGICALVSLSVTIVSCLCKRWIVSFVCKFGDNYVCGIRILFLFFFICMCIFLIIEIYQDVAQKKLRKEKLQYMSDVFCEMQGIAKVTEADTQKTKECIESISKKVTDGIKKKISKASNDNVEYKEKMENISETMSKTVTEIIQKEITEVDKGAIKGCCCCCCDYEKKTETTNDKTVSTTTKKFNCNCPSKIRADMFKAYANAIAEI